MEISVPLGEKYGINIYDMHGDNIHILKNVIFFKPHGTQNKDIIRVGSFVRYDKNSANGRFHFTLKEKDLMTVNGTEYMLAPWKVVKMMSEHFDTGGKFVISYRGKAHVYRENYFLKSGCLLYNKDRYGYGLFPLVAIPMRRK